MQLIQEFLVFSPHTQMLIVSVTVLFEPGSLLSVSVNAAEDGAA